MLHWYVVHRRSKRLPPVAQAFKSFLMTDGAAMIEQTIGVRPKQASKTGQALSEAGSTPRGRTA